MSQSSDDDDHLVFGRDDEQPPQSGPPEAEQAPPPEPPREPRQYPTYVERSVYVQARHYADGSYDAPTQYIEQQTYEPQNYEQQPYEQQPYQPQGYQPQGYQQQGYEQRAYEPQGYEHDYEQVDGEPEQPGPYAGEGDVQRDADPAPRGDAAPAGSPYGAPDGGYGAAPYEAQGEASGYDAVGSWAQGYDAPGPAEPDQGGSRRDRGRRRSPAASAPGGPGFGPVPRPEELLVVTRRNVADEPATWGWRGRVSRITGGLIKPRAGSGELDHRRSVVDIQRSFSRPMTVVVIQPKGGAGKTPTTICLSAAFGAHRGGYVVGWDDNETRGTLAVRVANPDNQRATVWDLLSELPAFERFDARVGDLSFYVRAQPDAHFDALVSDDNPANMAQIGEEEFHRLHQVLQRFYRMIVVDTGNNVRSANWQAAVNAADLVVVVSTYQRDVGYSASWVLDHLAQTGREGLARNAVTVLTAADPTTDKAVRDQLVSHFTARTRAVIEIPYDPELAHGGPIGWTALTELTRQAWIRAGATIADALAEQDEQVLAARRA